MTPILPGYDPSLEMGSKSHTTIIVPTREARICLLIRQLLILEPAVLYAPIIFNDFLDPDRHLLCRSSNGNFFLASRTLKIQNKVSESPWQCQETFAIPFPKYFQRL
ncbi:hypothetical protein AVEN_130982-1 [Araneus ventricosus]|uniref:Uncharacterized protein n=1 Tax=Araneus ventricosus TaxID=182803 RepID=A0A4Y2UZY3_ARAVE|nr:hypothetical protein AVEN_108891-1 [Araneus ventricosus]GBO17674.1 hypothetical protein AVEN_130982-1 [Araneus ventricosus]